MPSHPTAYVSGSGAWRVVDSSLTGSNLMKPPRRLGGSMVWGKGKGRLSVSLTLGIALPCNALRGGWAPPSQPPPLRKKKPHTKSHRVGKGMIPQRGTLGLPGLPGLTGVRRSAGRVRRSAGRGAEPPPPPPRQSLGVRRFAERVALLCNALRGQKGDIPVPPLGGSGPTPQPVRRNTEGGVEPPPGRALGFVGHPRPKAPKGRQGSPFGGSSRGELGPCIASNATPCEAYEACEACL